ncbi:MAG: cupin domain-containing protein [Nitrospira sp.]|nr:cupin domain-containing protein [Nitrospira sp.]
MTEIELPRDREEMAMLRALGILDVQDRQALAGTVEDESASFRRTVRVYEELAGLLAYAVKPVPPPPTLRDRLVDRIALEATHEAAQFELTADTVAFGAGSVKPSDSLRERLLSRIGSHQAVRNADAMSGLRSDDPIDERSPVLPQDAGLPADRWRSRWTVMKHLLRTCLIRLVTSERVGYWKDKIAGRQPIKGLTFIKASEGTWREIAPGVTAKLLSFDPASRRITTLLRFAPGTRYAPHRHTAVEELYVLEGGCRIAGRPMAVGDYHRAEAGTVHQDTSTDDGCLLLAISSPQNETVP